MSNRCPRGRDLSPIVLLAILTLVSLACASSKLTKIDRQAPAEVAKPDRVVVFDLAVTAGDVPPDSPLRSIMILDDHGQTPADLKLGRELGSLKSRELTERLNALGLNTIRAMGMGTSVSLNPNDVVIRGGFVEIEEGNMAGRVLIGFGAGANELKTYFDVYQVTPAGRLQLGTAEFRAAGGKMPGMLLSMGVSGVAKGIAVGGAAAAGKEFSSESLEGAAQRTAAEFIETVKPGLIEREWIEND